MKTPIAFLLLLASSIAAARGGASKYSTGGAWIFLFYVAVGIGGAVTAYFAWWRKAKPRIKEWFAEQRRRDQLK